MKQALCPDACRAIPDCVGITLQNCSSTGTASDCPACRIWCTNTRQELENRVDAVVHKSRTLVHHFMGSARRHNFVALRLEDFNETWLQQLAWVMRPSLSRTQERLVISDEMRQRALTTHFSYSSSRGFAASGESEQIGRQVHRTKCRVDRDLDGFQRWAFCDGAAPNVRGVEAGSNAMAMPISINLRVALGIVTSQRTRHRLLQVCP